MTTQTAELPAAPPVFSTCRSPGPDAFRRAMGLFPTGVTLITSGSGERTEAMTASSVTSVSLDPLLVLISIGATGRLRTSIENTGAFAVNVLAEGQQELSAQFASRTRPRGLAAQQRLSTANGQALTGTSGAVLVPDAVLALECRTERCYPGGDHVLFLGRVEALHVGAAPREPLLYHRGSYAALADRAER